MRALSRGVTYTITLPNCQWCNALRDHVDHLGLALRHPLDHQHPPTVQVRVGPAVALTLDDARADIERIMAAIVDQLPPEARVRHEPTADEIALMSPP